MLVLESKLVGKPAQFVLIDEAIRTFQFVRNKALRYWLDNRGASKYELNRQCAILAKEFEWAGKLNSMARQSAAERAWAAVSRFFENCKKKLVGKKGFPKFQKDNRSVEYKTTGWKLCPTPVHQPELLKLCGHGEEIPIHTHPRLPVRMRVGPGPQCRLEHPGSRTQNYGGSHRKSLPLGQRESNAWGENGLYN